MMPQKLFMVLTTVLLSSTICKGNQEYDTIVVGMGAAGTVAASTLARAGKKVLALEAQGRIGGRVMTASFGDGVVEVGAEWIHGTEDSRVYMTAINNSIDVLEQDLQANIVQSDARQANAIVNEIIEKSFEFMDLNVDKAEPFGEFLTKKLTDYIREKAPDVLEDKDLMTQLFALINLMVQNSEAANDWNDLNAADAFVPLGGHLHASWHKHGYKTFFDIMLNKYKDGPELPTLDIKIKSEVTKIEWPQKPEEKVSVTTKDGTVYKADNVIVTVSLGVLKNGYKTLFSPTLPQEKITAIEKLQIGAIGKIIFSFPSAWWPSKNELYGFLWKGEDLKKLTAEDQWLTKIVGATSPMGSSNTLTVWICGDGTKKVETMPEDVVKAKTIALLRQFMGPNITIPEPTGMLRSKWFSNEFTRGTYSYESMTAADFPTARTDLAAPLKDTAGKPRVLFAGEASHPTRFSTVHGAADTGHREAMRLIEAKS